MVLEYASVVLSYCNSGYRRFELLLQRRALLNSRSEAVFALQRLMLDPANETVSNFFVWRSRHVPHSACNSQIGHWLDDWLIAFPKAHGPALKAVRGCSASGRSRRKPCKRSTDGDEVPRIHAAAVP